MPSRLLDIQHLSIRYKTVNGLVTVVDDINLSLAAGESLALVGESGCGKSQSMLAVMGLLGKNSMTEGKILFEGKDLRQASERQLNRIRGNKIAIVFQDPMTSLNPYLRISTQMTEVLIQHQGCDYRTALQASIKLLDAVKIADSKNRIHQHPHQFSGGMRQRVMIAMALLAKPELLIADEPTTALDVTVQAQILELLKSLQQEFNTGLILITHDLGVVAGTCERVAVLYAGRIVEFAGVSELFTHPQHPYTQGLLKSIPRLDSPRTDRLQTIPGHPPDPAQPREGCAFYPRCHLSIDHHCLQQPPILETTFNDTHTVACPLVSQWFE